MNKKIKLPWKKAALLGMEEYSLNTIIEKENFSYTGTDLLSDIEKIHKEQMEKAIKKEKDDSVDPFDIFGHGIISYFRMIESLICVFFVCTLIFMPVIYLYS